MSNHETFLRFRNLLTQAVVAYNADETISWDVRASGMSPAYVRGRLRAIMKAYVVSPRWHEDTIPSNTIQSILNDWSVRETDDGCVEIGPRKNPYRTPYQLSSPSSSPSELTITIDGTNHAFIHAIALLKNHDQIPQSVLLTNFDTSLLDPLLSTYPNIELIPDTIAGVQTSNYILI